MNTDRFKFRAWHDEDGEMVYFDNQNVARDQYQAECFMDLFAGKFGDVMMQCTGFKDKAEKLIYWGDLVSDDDGELFRVDQVNGAWMLVDDINGCDELFYFMDIPSMRIIGNIHENGDLLK